MKGKMYYEQMEFYARPCHMVSEWEMERSKETLALQIEANAGGKCRIRFVQFNGRCKFTNLCTIKLIAIGRRMYIGKDQDKSTDIVYTCGKPCEG